MSNKNFDQALRYVLIDEGGNDDDPNDHGGRTSRGITQREYDSWRTLNGKTGSADVWKASSNDIKAIYRTQYWNPYCDSLPAGVDYVFFDTAVNAGRQQAVRSFQKALGVAADGMMGQITLSAINTSDPSTLISQVSEVRRDFYRNLRQFPRYGKGWLRRVDHCEHGALALLSETDYHKPTSVPTVPKADENDTSKTTVSPETSTTTAAGVGGLIGLLNSFKEALQPYASEIKYVTYALLAIAAVSFAYGLYGFMHRSKVQAAT